MIRKLCSNLIRSTPKVLFSSVKTIPSKQFYRRIFVVSTLSAASAFYFSNHKAADIQYYNAETSADLQDGQMRAIQLGPKEEDSVVLIKQNNKYYCVQNSCPHFGFALSKGLLFGDKIVCPLHNAGFSIQTGQAQQGPVYRSIKTYKITEQNGKIKIQVPKNQLNTSQDTKMATKKNDNNPVVIIGGGPASLSAVQTLRQAGFDGSITLISKDENLPYDRTGLSKNINAKPETSVIRKKQFYDTYGIDVKINSQVESIDYSKNQVILKDKSKISYKNLLIATGSQNVFPTIKGAQKIPRLSVRTLGDVQKIRNAAKTEGTKNVTIIGGGFIGLQLASSLKTEFKDKVNITILERNQVALQTVLGKEVGRSVQSLAQKNGIKFENQCKIKEIVSNDSKPISVELNNKSIPTDLVIFATGVKPVTNFIGNLKLDSENRGIKTDAFLRTSQNNVFAAGDVASYPYWYTGESVRIEHYTQAIYQGSVAALNILNKKLPVDNVPFFWTRSFNTSLQYTGATKSWDEVYISGSLQEQKFIAYYIKKDKVVSAASMNSFQSIMIINEAMRYGVLPKASVIKSKDFKVQSLKQQISKKKPKCSRCTKCTF